MELMTKEIREQFKKIGRQEKLSAGEHVCVVKFFQPWGSWTWYATELSGKGMFYGLVDGFELEWGSFSLSELESVTGPFGLKIERDLHFGTPKLKDVPALKGRIW